MIDKVARKEGIRLLEKMKEGRVTPAEFEDAWPTSDDLAVRSVAFWIWSLFDDDAVEPILFAPESEEEKILMNSVNFLSSDLELRPQNSGLSHRVRTALANGVEWNGCELPWHERWPFPVEEDHFR